MSLQVSIHNSQHLASTQRFKAKRLITHKSFLCVCETFPDCFFALPRPGMAKNELLPFRRISYVSQKYAHCSTTEIYHAMILRKGVMRRLMCSISRENRHRSKQYFLAAFTDERCNKRRNVVPKPLSLKNEKRTF